MPAPARVERKISVLDALDRVLDKGVVIDAAMRMSILGLDVSTIDTAVVVASVETYARYGLHDYAHALKYPARGG